MTLKKKKQSTSCRSYDIHYENDIKKTRSSQHPAEAVTYIMKMTLTKENDIKKTRQSTSCRSYDIHYENDMKKKMTLKRQEAVNMQKL